MRLGLVGKNGHYEVKPREPDFNLPLVFLKSRTICKKTKMSLEYQGVF